MKPHLIQLIQYRRKRTDPLRFSPWLPGLLIDVDDPNEFSWEIIECVNHESSLDYLKGI